MPPKIPEMPKPKRGPEAYENDFGIDEDVEDSYDEGFLDEFFEEEGLEEDA